MRSILLLTALLPLSLPAAEPAMKWADPSRNGAEFAKDPAVIRLGERYLMYYSMPPATNPSVAPGWAVGIAESRDLVAWSKVGELLPAQEADAKGLAAPEAIVLKDRVHLFYQTYGNGPKDAICHAVSDDGLHFVRDASNPVFAPTGTWTVGRAIDAEVHPIGDQLFLWVATRDPAMKTQMVAVASAPLDSDYGRATWVQRSDAPVLKPELPWERKCIEAASVLKRGDTYWMFYAGGYNNEPQQIGVATSKDGLAWTRWSDEPLLPNGAPGTWNSSESGHPGIFADQDGRTYLFFQGNNSKGKTWYLSAVELGWNDKGPFVKKDSDKFPVR